MHVVDALLQVGQVMEQVDARCPQALKSPAEDEVRKAKEQKKADKVPDGA